MVDVLLCDCPHNESLFLDWIYVLYFLELMAPSPMMKGEIQLLNCCVLPLRLLLFYALTWCLFIKLAQGDVAVTSFEFWVIVMR